eukprot:COSAG02_NODE_657_length_18797_cov_34.071238_12_plen_100_part_00
MEVGCDGGPGRAPNKVVPQIVAGDVQLGVEDADELVRHPLVSASVLGVAVVGGIGALERMVRRGAERQAVGAHLLGRGRLVQLLRQQLADVGRAVVAGG